MIKLKKYYHSIKDIVKFSHFDPEKIWLFRKVRHYTMVPSSGLRKVYDLAKIVERKGLNGDFIECGVWKGGCSAIMAYVSKKYGSDRKVWLFDSFEGLPEPVPKDGIEAKKFASFKNSGKLGGIGKNVCSIADSKRIFSILNLEKSMVLRKGWFQHTIPKAKRDINSIALLRLDGDWYESTKVCLENLYEKVVPGGYVIIDDYLHWEGCRKAVDEFIMKKKIKAELIKINSDAVYFQVER